MRNARIGNIMARRLSNSVTNSRIPRVRKKRENEGRGAEAVLLRMTAGRPDLGNADWERVRFLR